jgi:hypothetical protein
MLKLVILIIVHYAPSGGGDRIYVPASRPFVLFLGIGIYHLKEDKWWIHTILDKVERINF